MASQVRKPAAVGKQLKSQTQVQRTQQQKSSSDMEGEETVESFLTAQCERVIEELRTHGAVMVEKLRSDFEEGSRRVDEYISSSIVSKKISVTLKCIAGPHLGSKFKLEPSSESGDDAFKIGRSTGRMFKERGVSLYKDKETSTTHAKIETRNGQVFLIDMRSTNGTLLNGINIESQIPYRLEEGDVFSLGSTELRVLTLACAGLVGGADNAGSLTM